MDRHASRAVITSRTNDRPRPAGLVRRAIVAIIATVGLVLGSVAMAPTAAAGTRVGAVNPRIVGQQASFDQQMIAYVNQARIAHGVPALQEASGLTIMSAWWSRQMTEGATGGNLQHNPNAWTQVTAYGAANRRAWGENVAKLPTGTTAKALFDAYMASPSHKANILSTKYHFIGMGTIGNASWQFNTMEFTDQVEARTIIYVSATKKPAAKAAKK